MNKFTKTFPSRYNNPTMIQSMEEQGWKLKQVKNGQPIMELLVNQRIIIQTKKKQNNTDAFEKVMKDITKCTEDINDNIVKKGEIVCAGRRANCFCFGKFKY